MEITCPACRKVNLSMTQCGRCGADLGDLVRIVQAADFLLADGRRHLRRDDGTKALAAAQSAWALKHSTAAARLAFLACLHQRHWEAARIWYRLAIDPARDQSHRRCEAR